MKTTGKEKGNMRPGDWAVIGLKRWTFAPHVEEMKRDITILSCFHLWFCFFQYFFDTSSCLHLSLQFSPSRLIQFVCIWKNTKTKNRGKKRDSRGRIKGKKAPWGDVVKKISHLTAPLFSICDNASLTVYLIPAICPQKTLHFNSWDDFRPKSTFRPVDFRDPPSPASQWRYPPFTLSFLPPCRCLSFLPSNHSLLVYSSGSGSFLMSSEMWSRDHSETGRHRPSPNSHHSSIIHMLIFISGMKTFILKWDSFFMSWSGVRLHLFWQKTSVFPARWRNFLYMEVQGFKVKTSSSRSGYNWATREHGNLSMCLDNALYVHTILTIKTLSWFRLTQILTFSSEKLTVVAET